MIEQTIGDCIRELTKAHALLKAIADALGTGESGENLVAVARDAARAEAELAGIQMKAERELRDY